MRTAAFCTAMCITLAWTALAAAQSPVLPVQGTLRTSEGSLVDGDRLVTFRLYNEATGGTAFYEVSASVAFEDGRFVAYLGDGEPLPLEDFDGIPNMYLGIEIAAEGVEMLPRVRLGTAPFSIFSQLCGEAEVALDLDEGAKTQFAESAHSHTASQVTGVANATHSHTASQVSGVANATHNHTASQVSGVAASSHSHGTSDLTGVAAASHGHAIYATTSHSHPTPSCRTETVSFSVPANDDRGAIATCLSGYTMTGGGCTYNGIGASSRQLMASLPTSNGWHCLYWNSGNSSYNAQTFARCCRF